MRVTPLYTALLLLSLYMVDGSATVHAAAPLAHDAGKSAVPGETPPAPSVGSTSPVDYPQAEQLINDTLRNLNRPGSFDQNLSAPLQELASALLALGYYSDAVEITHQALHSNRSNEGLYNPGQLSLLDQLLQGYLLQGDWQEFSTWTEHLEWLLHKLHAGNPSALAQGLERLSDWHLAAAGRMANQYSGWHLVKARNLNWQAVSAIETHAGLEDLRLPPLLYRIVLNNYYLSTLTMRRGLTSFEYRGEEPVISNGWNRSRNESLRETYLSGLEVLQRIRQIYTAADTAPPQASTIMLIYLADWQLLFGRRDEALRTYRQAYEVLLSSGLERGQVRAYFSRTQVLPANSLMVEFPSRPDRETADAFIAWTGILPGVQMPQDHPLASAQRTKARATGRFMLKAPQEPAGSARAESFQHKVGSVQLLDYSPDHEATRERALDELSRLQLRPRLINKNILARQDVTLEYWFTQ